eukprot:6483530-Amphidinium_carterae.1
MSSRRLWGDAPCALRLELSFLYLPQLSCVNRRRLVRCSTSRNWGKTIQGSRTFTLVCMLAVARYHHERSAQ